MNEGGCLISIICFILVAGLIFGIVAVGWWLWGLIAVGVFSLPALTYWQFYGLYWLCRFLFCGGATSMAKVAAEWSKK